MSTNNNTIPHRIGGIMVLYNPDWNVTKEAIHSLADQVDKLVVVDNSPEEIDANLLEDLNNIIYLPMGKNLGIAAAQNIGIRYLKDMNFDLILFSDQDSYTPANLVDRLFEGFKLLKSKNIEIAVVGSRAINKQTGLPYPAKSKEIGVPVEFTEINCNCDITECYSVRSSVSLIPMRSFLKVGGFDEELFIDGVDHEWCWRAWHCCGLRSFIVEKAQIDHMLGEGDKKIVGKRVSIPSAFRVYYQFRNFLWLSKRSYTPKFWIKKNKKKYLVKAFYFPLMISPRLQYFRNIYKGIKDGLKLGKKRWPSFQEKKG